MRSEKFLRLFCGATLLLFVLASGVQAQETEEPPAADNESQAEGAEGGTEAAPGAPGGIEIPDEIGIMEGTGFSYDARGRRDPFISLALGLNILPPDKRIPGLGGMLIQGVSLRGIVRTSEGYIAMVQGTDNKSYFAREGERMYDGMIEAIDSEKIVFRQEINDLSELRSFNDWKSGSIRWRRGNDETLVVMGSGRGVGTRDGSLERRHGRRSGRGLAGARSCGHQGGPLPRGARSDAVWFETSGTLFYTHYSPDPLTLVIDLPSVDITAISDRTVVGSQEVESIIATELDGAGGKSLSRIEVKLSSLVPYQITATEHALTVLFEGAGSPAEALPISGTPSAPLAEAPITNVTPVTSVTSVTSDAADVPPVPAPADALVGHDEIATLPLPTEPAELDHPAEPANDDAPVVPVAPVAPVHIVPSVPVRAASTVDSISHTVSEGLLTVTVGGDGRLNYTSFRLADPPRLVFDFAATVNRVPAPRLAIDAAGVYRARVAQFQSANPQITRIVFDLDGEVHHRALSEGSDLTIYFSVSAVRLAELVGDADDVSSNEVAGGGHSVQWSGRFHGLRTRWTR